MKHYKATEFISNDTSFEKKVKKISLESETL